MRSTSEARLLSSTGTFRSSCLRWSLLEGEGGTESNQVVPSCCVQKFEPVYAWSSLVEVDEGSNTQQLTTLTGS